jgi:hypothetical protein
MLTPIKKIDPIMIINRVLWGQKQMFLCPQAVLA